MVIDKIYVDNVGVQILDIFGQALSENKYFSFDTESSFTGESKEEVHIYAWGLMSEISNVMVYGDKLSQLFEFFNRVQDHMFRNKMIKARPNKSNQVITKANIFVHNLGWDMEFLKHYLLRNNYRHYVDRVLNGERVFSKKESNTFNVVQNNNVTYSSSILSYNFTKVGRNKKEIEYITSIELIDSLKIISSSLDEIANKVINIDDKFKKIKGYDYEAIRGIDYKLNNEDIEYLYNDVYILKEFILQYYNVLDTKKRTYSAIAFESMLRHCFNGSMEMFKEHYPNAEDYTVRQIVKKAYNGGYCYASPYVKNRTINEYGIGIDINSSYPYILAHKPLPYGNAEYQKGQLEHKDGYMYFQRLNFDCFERKDNGCKYRNGFIKIGVKCDVLTDLKQFGLTRNDYVTTNILNGKCVTRNYDLYLCEEELEFLMNNYNFYYYDDMDELCEGVKYIEGVYYKVETGKMRSFIDYNNELKIKSKKDNNMVMYVLAKTNNNSLYGKMGSNPERILVDVKLDEKGNVVHERLTDNEYDYLSEEFYPPIASVTTSYARLRLWYVMAELELKYKDKPVFLYADTDSIYCTLSVDEILKLDSVEIDGTKLGAWDIEKEFNKFRTIGPKKYIYQGRKYSYKKNNNQPFKLVVKCCGIDEESKQQLNFDNFKIGTEVTKKQKVKIKGGYYINSKYKYQLKDYSFM